MKPLHFRLTLEVTIDPKGAGVEELKRGLKQIVRNAYDNGQFVSDYSPAIVLRYCFAVQQTNGSHTIPPLDRQ